jgi:hypothetical protein
VSAAKSHLPSYHQSCQSCGKHWQDDDLVLIGTPRTTLDVLRERFSIKDGFTRLQIAVGECCKSALSEINAFGGAIVDESPSTERIQAAKRRAEARLKELNIEIGDTDA